jgi:cell wall-associated NlpC family hydrolase
MHTQAYSRRGFSRILSCIPVFVLAGCATTPSPWLRSSRSSEAVSVGSDIAMFALSLLDMRYVSGGRGPATGFDCSGLVSHVYRQAAGIELRGSSASMAKASRPVSNEELLAGDLVFFNTLGQPFSHVGIFVGQGKFVHASNERTGVRSDSLSSKYYAARFEGAKTVLG